MRHQPRAAALAVLLALLGGTLTTLHVRAPAPPAAPPVGPSAVVPAAVVPAAVVPVRLDIPRIGLHTRLIQLGLDPDGTAQVPSPERDSPPGWYEHSPIPGEDGDTVLVGHVDPAHDGPTVFHRLGNLRPGDAVSVRRSDGVTVRFRVTGRSLHRTALDVHGATGPAGLRLVTCGGDFDPSRRRHRSNLVVFATAE